MTHKRVFYVSGKTGYGKTALSSTICKCYGTDLAGSHFFQSSAGVGGVVNYISSMIQSMASGLSRTCPMYMTYLADQYKHDPKFIDTVLCTNNWQGLYRLLLKNPLTDLYSACRTSRRRYMFVLDALNECRPNDWVHIKKFIEQFIQDLPSSFKLFVTMHPQYHAQFIPNMQDDIDGVLLENRYWVNQHIKDVEIYLARYK